MTRITLREALSRHPLLLDGAMGTELQRRGIKGNIDRVALDQPELLAEVHRAYLEAGADIIETCTFNAQRVSQAEYRADDKLIADINRQAARIAVAEARRMTELTPDHPRYVAGSVGPTNKILSLRESAEGLTFDALADAYREQMTALIEEGVDALLIETIVDTLNAKAAILAAREAMRIAGREVEIMLSMTLSDSSGRTLSGQTIEAFVASVMHARPLSIGLNCSFGAEGMHPYLLRLSACCPVYVTVHPNAGLPDQLGRYNDTPEQMAEVMARYLDEGIADVIGGCCGTTPAHIAAMRQAIDSCSAPRRSVPMLSTRLRLSGLEPLSETAPFVNVGERCNVAGSRKFLRLINEGSYDEALAIARRQVEDGAMMLDINMDDGLLDAPAQMEAFVRLIGDDPAICRVPLMIDSSSFDVIERALKLIQGKSVVNSISLKEGEGSFLAKARRIKELGAAVVVMAFDEQGQAVTLDRKIEVCSRAYRLLTEQAGLDPSDIIFDPNILTVATGMEEHLLYGRDFVEAARWIRANLPGASVSGGVSNLSFAFRGNNYLREAMHAVFLYRAIAAGMNMAIMNPAAKVAYADIDPALRQAIEDALFDRCDMASVERLIEMAPTAGAPAAAEAAVESDKPELTPGERLSQALIKGDASTLQADIAEALAIFPTPLAIVEGPLMEGMNEVGRRFGAGQMFLPQVVKTARTMKAAVDLLTPYMNAGDDLPSRGKVLLATVEGDVHDIGKNIVAVILQCNGFNVIDLGVMVTPERIVEAAKEHRPDAIGLSGLISPSLDAMARTVKALDAAGIDTPVIVGGATTSATHTAVKLAPIYRGPVIHALDAARDPAIIAQLLDPEQRDPFVAELQAQQADLRCRHEAKGGNHSPQEAYDRRPQYDWSAISLPAKPFDGVGETTSIPFDELRPLIDWRYFVTAWKVKPRTDEAARLIADAEALLDDLARDPENAPMAQLAFYDAAPSGDAILIDGSVELPTPRQPYDGERRECLALSDFIRPADGAIGVFAVTMSAAFMRHLEALKAEGNSYESLLMQTVGDRLAEAAAEALHRRAARDYGWSGIRPAVGYPSLPDQSAIFKLAALLPLAPLGITLTPAGAMYPQSSIAGFLITHPAARYFSVK